MHSIDHKNTACTNALINNTPSLMAINSALVPHLSEWVMATCIARYCPRFTVICLATTNAARYELPIAGSSVASSLPTEPGTCTWAGDRRCVCSCDPSASMLPCTAGSMKSMLGSVMVRHTMMS